MTDIYIPIVEVQMFDLHGLPVPFTLTFYGVPMREFMGIPSPAIPKIREALKRMKIEPDDVMVTPFGIRERFIRE